MKKNYLFVFILFFVSSTVLFSQNKHSITLSPGSLFLARFNIKYEKLNETRLTYGSRLEYSTAWRSLMIVPYGRIYPFSKESSGLYGEAGIGFRATFLPEDFWDDPNLSYQKFAPIARFMIGAQWFAGKKHNIPFDIGLGFNIDPLVFGNTEQTNDGSLILGLVGPFSLFNFRIQTGIAW